MYRSVKPANELVALVRDLEKAMDLTALGIEVRQGDYLDAELLKLAFKGIEKVMLTPTHAVTDRKTAEAGVKHVVNMPIIRKSNSTYVLPEVTEVDIFTEKLLKSSGLVYTLVKHPPFLESISRYIGLNAPETGRPSSARQRKIRRGVPR